MSYDIELITADSRIISREELNHALRSRGWEQRYVVPHSLDPAPSTGLLDNDMMVLWQATSSFSDELSRLFSPDRSSRCSFGFLAAWRRRLVKKRVTELWLLQRFAIAELSVDRLSAERRVPNVPGLQSIPGGSQFINACDRIRYYLRSSAGRTPFELELQVYVARVIGELRGGLFLDPQFGETAWIAAMLR